MGIQDSIKRESDSKSDLFRCGPFHKSFSTERKWATRMQGRTGVRTRTARHPTKVGHGRHGMLLSETKCQSAQTISDHNLCYLGIDFDSIFDGDVQNVVENLNRLRISSRSLTNEYDPGCIFTAFLARCHLSPNESNHPTRLLYCIGQKRSSPLFWRW